MLFIDFYAHGAILNCTFSGQACPKFTYTSLSQKNEDISVPGAPISPYVDTITTSVDIRGYPSFSQLTTINVIEFPSKLFNIFTNLKTFNAESAGIGPIVEISTDSVYNCKSLNTFSIRNSNIQRVGAGFASTCTNLTEVDFYDCNVQTLSENAFKGLSNLRILDMRRNKVTCIPSTLFQYSRNIATVIFAENLITAVHSQLFAGLNKLGYFSIDVNKLEYIPNFNLNGTGIELYSSLNKIIFEFSNNPIRAISPTFLTYLKSINKIVGTPNYLSLQFKPSTVTTCVNPTLTTGFTGDIFNIGNNTNWQLQNSTYQTSTTCYSAFNDDMKYDRLATCGTCGGTEFVRKISEQLRTLLATVETCYPELKTSVCGV